MAKSQTSYIFYFSQLTKSWKKGKRPPKLEFYQFESDRTLCVVHVLDEYLNRSQKWRTGWKHQLLISQLRPHNEVAKSTISGWVKTVLKDSGIDTTIFKAHSCRTASTSKAKIMRLSLEGILERGQWSGKSALQKHYHKPI